MYELPKEHYITVDICKQQIIKEQQKNQGLFQSYFTEIEKKTFPKHGIFLHVRESNPCRSNTSHVFYR